MNPLLRASAKVSGPYVCTNLRPMRSSLSNRCSSTENWRSSLQSYTIIVSRTPTKRFFSNRLSRGISDPYLFAYPQPDDSRQPPPRGPSPRLLPPASSSSEPGAGIDLGAAHRTPRHGNVADYETEPASLIGTPRTAGRLLGRRRCGRQGTRRACPPGVGRRTGARRIRLAAPDLVGSATTRTRVATRP